MLAGPDLKTLGSAFNAARTRRSPRKRAGFSIAPRRALIDLGFRTTAASPL